jgi:sulfide:quinone oxidoreductase
MSQTHPLKAARPAGPAVLPTTVVIAGGGVGAVEAALALRAHFGEAATIELVAPEDAFVYRPLSVLEAFGQAPPHRVPLERLERSHNIGHRRAAVIGVDAEARTVSLDDGSTLGYDRLVVATGARPQVWLPAALTFGGSDAVSDFQALLARIEAGEVKRLVLAAPPESSWPLGLYDLALLTATWAAGKGIEDLQVTVVTPDAEPLESFGPGAGRAVRQAFADHDLNVMTGSPVAAYDGTEVVLEDGRRMEADAVVALPGLAGSPIAGLPADVDGFIPTDAYGAVAGCEDVYAVGDNTAFPIKQGGLAAQQADAATAAIAASRGAKVEPVPFAPALHGLLLTGATPVYLRAGTEHDPTDDTTVAHGPLWWPPTKVAGRHLGPYLAEQDDIFLEPELEAAGPGFTDAARAREQLRKRAIDLARYDAEMGEYESALDWLATLDRIDGGLDEQHAELQAQWSAAAARG